MTTKNNDTLVAGKQTTVSIIRTFNLPVNTVWKAWSDPENFKKWWGPKDYTCPYAAINFKSGGKYLACMKSPEGNEFWSTGIIKEIVPLKRIVYTDSFADSNGDVVPASHYNMPGEWPTELKVTVVLESADGKTNLILRQEGIPEEMHDDCVTGWQQSFDKLENNLK